MSRGSSARRKRRRIPPIPSPKSSNGEDRPNARDLLDSVNTASGAASASWIAFLGAMAYLAVALGGVSHVDLLLNNDTKLPFVDVKVPLNTFFVMAPLAFVLVHFALLVQHEALYRKLQAFEERLKKEVPSLSRSEQNIREELNSYFFTQAVSGKPRRAPIEAALGLMMSLSFVILPLLVLVFFQISFLPYHSDETTWWHRILLVVDIVFLVAISRYLRDVGRASKLKLSAWVRETIRGARAAVSSLSLPIRGRDYAPPFARVAGLVLHGTQKGSILAIRYLSPNSIVIGVLVLFSFCVATLPDSLLDKATRSIQYLSEPMPYCRPTTIDMTDEQRSEEKCPEITTGTRHAFWLTAYLFERKVNDTTGRPDSVLGWSRNLIVTDKKLIDEKKEIPLNLRGRDLRYATLDRSDLKRADLFGADLERGRLVDTNLQGADLSRASLRETYLHRAGLRGANLSLAKLRGAIFSDATLQGANLALGELDGVDLSLARMQGADLSGALLQNANLRGAHLQGADLSGAELQGADLSGRGLKGADLRDANLKGVDLSGAWLQGADLSRAKLQGANLRGAGLQGANLRQAMLQGADLTGTNLWHTGMPGFEGMPAKDDEWDLVSFSQMNIRELAHNERDMIHNTIVELESVQQGFAQEGTPVRERIAKAASGLRDFLKINEDDKWKNGGLATWCRLTRQPPPDSSKLSTYLGTLVCKDSTDKAYMAQRLIYRALEREPKAFFEAIKGCPVFGRIPADLKSRLERAAQEDKEKAAKPKESLEKIAQPTARQPPDICASLIQ